MLRFDRIPLLLALLALGACELDRSVIPGPLGRVAPQQFCPGDTVTASYDLQLSDACPAGVDCAPYRPNVDVSSNPGAFPPTRINDYLGSLDFVPAADRTEVTFASDRNPVLIPTDRFRDGARVFLERGFSAPGVHAVTRITGTIERELLHEGVCAGSTPMNASAELPGPPQLSPNMGLVEVCNASGVPVVLSLDAPSTATGMENIPLNASQCAVPSPSATGRVVTVRPQSADPAARCSAVGGGFMPPRTLRTRVRMACR